MFVYSYLVVSRLEINFGVHGRPMEFVQQLLDHRNRELVEYSDMIQCLVIDTEPPACILVLTNNTGLE